MDAQQILDRVFELSKADEVAVAIRSGTLSHLRFSQNSASTSGHVVDTEVTVTSTYGKKSASASGNRLEALVALVTRSEELAQLAPEDPELMPGLDGTVLADVRGWKEPAPAERMVEGVGEVIRAAESAGSQAAGFAQTWDGELTYGTKKGVLGRHKASWASLSATARHEAERGSGWASGAGLTWTDIDVAKLAGTATAKAALSRQPRPLPPGEYETVLEPACVSNLVNSLVNAMDRRNADEGRSVFAKKGGTRLGEKLFPDAIHIWSDPADPAVPVAPWGEDGLALGRHDWIEQGVVKELPTGRFWADKMKTAPIPSPRNVIMGGGDASLEELVASMKKGVLVTRLWYIRMLQPETLLLTGLTRDGVFWVEDGKIAYPVNNFRFNESPVRMLQNVEALGRPQVVAGWDGSPDTVVPPLKVKAFHFASVSEAV